MAGGTGTATPAANGFTPSAQYTPTQQPNIFDQSAGAYTDALSTAQGAAKAASGIRAGNSFQSISAPANVTAGQLSSTDLSPYMNPYQSDVIDVTISDLERARQMALNDVGGAATAAGAFGGSRHGVAMAEAMRGYDDNLARTMANLNSQNFQQAQQAGQFDISSALLADQGNQTSQLQASIANQAARIQAAQVQAQAAAARAQALNSAAATQGQLSNLGFGMGMGVNNAMMQAGGMQQALQQQLIDQAMGQYGGWAGSPAASTQLVGQAIGGVPGGGGSTSTYQPGLFDYLTAGATIGSIPLATAAAGATAPTLGGTLLAGLPFPCWVAREVYGPTNPAWLDFRDWMINRAPAWLRRAYIKHGPKWAEWVKRNPWSKRVLRPLMDMVR